MTNRDQVLDELSAALVAEHHANEAMLASVEAARAKIKPAPWKENPYKLVSLWDIINTVSGPQPDPTLYMGHVLAVAKVRALVRQHLLPPAPSQPEEQSP